MTPIWGMTEGGVKTTGRDARVLPRLVVYDPNLLTTLPPEVVATSGMNAIAHCVEALYSETANPVTSLMAEEGVSAIAEALPRAAKSRRQASKGASPVRRLAWRDGSRRCRDGAPPQALSHARRQLRSSPRGGSYDHHSACGRVQHSSGAGGHVAGRSRPGQDPDRGRRRRLVRPDRGYGAKTKLSEIGMKEADLDRAADLATRNPYYNPRPVARELIRRLLNDAISAGGPRPHCAPHADT